MHRTLRPFELLEPEDLEEALRLLELHCRDVKILAGGLNLISDMRRWKCHPEYVLSVRHLPGLKSISGDDSGGIRIGALTSIRSLELSSAIRGKYSLLHEAARQIASVQVKTMGTVVGNLCAASPASDIAPVLLVLGARLNIRGPNRERGVQVSDFFKGPGLTVLAPDEIVTEIAIPPLPEGWSGAFLKTAQTSASIAKVNAAVTLKVEDGFCKEARIALGAVAPTVMRAKSSEEILMDQRLEPDIIQKAADAAEEDALPITDLRASAGYRKEIVGVLVRRAIEKACEAGTRQPKKGNL
jgi:aerobic carbon-monoxide dehydrogenase medium subunit